MRRGRFLTFEGIEGAGKSTQVRLLAEALARAGQDTWTTREPGGAPGAEAIRRLLLNPAGGRWSPLTEALLHYAARREHLDRAVLEAVARGRWVVCDRFADSTSAYQGFGQGLDHNVIAQLHGLVVGSFGPDLTLVLDLDVDQGLARVQQRSPGRDRYERMARGFHGRVRNGFLAIAAAAPDRCVVIDASQSADQVHRAVWRAVVAKFPDELAAGDAGDR